MSSYKISFLEDIALRIDYTGERSSLLEFIDKAYKKGITFMGSEELKNDGKIRLAMLDFKTNLISNYCNKDDSLHPLYVKPDLIKHLLNNKSIKPYKEKEADDYGLIEKVYKPKHKKKCFKLFKEYVKETGAEPNVAFGNKYFTWLRYSDGVFAAISVKYAPKGHIKKAYPKIDKYMYKIFGEHLPSFEEVEKCAEKSKWLQDPRALIIKGREKNGF
jgi:hypothetical protein